MSSVVWVLIGAGVVTGSLWWGVRRVLRRSAAEVTGGAADGGGPRDRQAVRYRPDGPPSARDRWGSRHRY
ncbi:hypothetical protein [Streptomyces sp. NPDC093111]|uniref:hypothetical protein n=1 Tax=Streptomyces sp. NPDC093111 TaxID=3154978 RepID=UPI00342FB11C